MHINKNHDFSNKTEFNGQNKNWPNIINYGLYDFRKILEY